MKSSSVKPNIIVISNILLSFIWVIFILITIIQVIKEQKLLTDINKLILSTNNLKTNITPLLSQISYHNELSYYNIFTDNNIKINDNLTLTQSHILDIILYPFHSDIITNMNELNFIRKHLGNASIHLIYKSSIHGDSAKAFHNKVSIQSHLLFLIKTTLGTKFGGYTSQSLY